MPGCEPTTNGGSFVSAFLCDAGCRRDLGALALQRLGREVYVPAEVYHDAELVEGRGFCDKGAVGLVRIGPVHDLHVIGLVSSHELVAGYAV